MLELLIAAAFQLSVLVSGAAPATKTDATAASTQATKSTPTTPTTKIGGTGWDDRN